MSPMAVNHCNIFAHHIIIIIIIVILEVQHAKVCAEARHCSQPCPPTHYCSLPSLLPCPPAACLAVIWACGPRERGQEVLNTLHGDQLFGRPDRHGYIAQITWFLQYPSDIHL